jgi:hypothetical protein
VISTTPADTTRTDTTPVGPIPLTGTWFARVGLRPYHLLGLIDRAPSPRTPVRTIPRLDLAA